MPVGTVRDALRHGAERLLRFQPHAYAFLRRRRQRERERREREDAARRIVPSLSPLSPDVILGHDIQPGHMTEWLAERLNVPFVVDVVDLPRMHDRSGEAFRRLPARWAREVDERALRHLHRARTLLTTSEGHSRWLAERGLASTCVLNARSLAQHGLAPEPDLRRHLGLSADARLLVMHNQIAPGYGAERLLDALPFLPARWHVLFAGPFVPRGYEKEVLRHARRAGVDERVRTLPPLWDERLVQRLRACDVAAMAFDRGIANIELGMPNRVFDCLAADLPLVAPALEELRERTGWGHIHLCDTDDPREMARAVERADASRGATPRRAPVWDEERKKLLRTLADVAAKASPPNVLLVAAKDAARNNRIRRFAGAIEAAGGRAAVIDRVGERFRLHSGAPPPRR